MLTIESLMTVISLCITCFSLGYSTLDFKERKNQ